ncbi:glycosyltransferase [Paenibacillus sp. FSL R10-2736]|uniref:glycosyltransferase n=1 Tax=Paenibacillus sp. FSL R10-2736 TaxID=2954692 RepID=UPI0030FBBC4F
MEEAEKIAIFIGSLARGGAERVSVLLGEYFNKKGVEVYIITLNTNFNEYQINSRIRRIILNEEEKGKWQWIHMVKKLKVILSELKPTAVLVMGVPLCMYVVPALIGTKIPLLVSERNDPSNFKGRKIIGLLSKSLMRLASGFIFQTEGAQNQYSKKIQQRSVVISNPIDINIFPEESLEYKNKKIVSVGRLVPQKNHELLINVFAKISKDYPEYSLIIYGEGRERNSLQKIIDSHNLSEKIILAGVKEDVLNQINDAELFVMSSNFEGLPNALIEAMALGIPVISTNCPSGGPASLIRHEFNGLLVPVGDKNELEKAVRLLLSDKNYAAELGRNAYNIRATLDIDVIGYHWFDFIRKFK